MYHKGDLEFTENDYDAREDDGYDKTYKYYCKKVISLPHSCGSWVIGGKEEAKIMIAELNKLLAQKGDE